MKPPRSNLKIKHEINYGIKSFYSRGAGKLKLCLVQIIMLYMVWYGNILFDLVHNIIENILLKGTDQAGTFMSLKCVVYNANYRSWHQSSKIQVVS